MAAQLDRSLPDMEMEFTDRGRRRRLLMVIGLLMAVIAGGTAFYLGNQGQATAAPVQTQKVVVAAVDIPARTVIEPAFLTVREVPVDPSLSLAVTDPNQVLGLVTAVTVYADQVITPNLLATSAAGAAFSILKPTETISPDSPFWRAVSVMVPKERAVGGLIEPGQRVDLIASVQIEIKVVGKDGAVTEGPTVEGYYGDSSTKVSWLDLEVLTKNPDNDIYVLKVDLHQAEEIAQVQASGENSFGIALRPEGDNRMIDRGGYGETVNRIIEQYNFPLPMIIQVERYPQPSPEIPVEPTPQPTSSPSPAPAASPLASPEPSPAPLPTPKTRD